MIEESVSNRTNGKIPAFTECPFKYRCDWAKKGVCHHKGEKHNTEYSCGVARAYDLLHIAGVSDK